MKKVLFSATVDSHIMKFHLPYLRFFKENGYEVHVASKGKNVIPSVDVKYNVPFSRSPIDKKNITAFRQLKEIIKSNNFNVIHTNTPMGGVLTRLAAKKFRENGLKVIYTAHGFHFYKGAPVFNWLFYYPVEKYLSKYTDCLITINQEDFELSNKFNSIRNIMVHGVGVDLFKFKPVDLIEKKDIRKELGYDPDDFIVIYPAELSERKNQTLLIEITADLKREIPNLKVILAGEDTLKEHYSALAQKLNVIKEIYFLGFRTDVNRLIAMSDVLVSTSKQEGLPVNVMEAMATGVPVVASKIRGHIDLIDDNQSGTLFELTNKEKLRTDILVIYNNKKLGGLMGRNSREKMKKYSLENVMCEMKEVYTQFM